jgi:hypothetical protein
MRPIPIPRRLSALLLAAAALGGGRAAHAADPPDLAEAAFLAENEAAMNRMMDAMAVQPTGDVDRDFVAVMIPHHQGAIDMAQAVLRHGRNEQIRRIAQGIIVEQQQEILAMRIALGLPLSDAAPAASAAPASPHHHGSH